MAKIFIALFLILSLQGSHTYAQNHARFRDFKAGMIDENLVKQALKIANERALNLRCPETYTKGIILSYNWINELDKNGFVNARRIHIELYSERPDGRCAIADYTFKQKHEIDDVFSKKLIFEKVGGSYFVDCE